MKRNLVIFIRILASAGISFLVLGLMLRLFTGDDQAADRPRLLDVLRATWRPALGLYAALAIAQALFRAIRYRVLIAAGRASAVPRLAHTFEVTLVRNMLVDLLPARLGELSYIGMMNVGCRVPGDLCLSSLGISFVFDFLALFVIVIAVIVHQLLGASLQGWLVTAALFLLVIGIVLTVLLFTGVSFVARILDRLPTRWRRIRAVDQGLGFLRNVAMAIARARKAGVVARVAWLSLAVRLTKYTALYVLFKAIAVPSFPGLSTASFPEILSALLSAEGMSSLPVPAFMSFGTYEAGGTLAFKLLGFGEAEAIIAMLAIHVWSQLMDYTLGGIGSVLFLFRRRGRAPTERPVRAPARQAGWALATLAVVLAGFGLLGWQWRAARRLGALEAPARGEAIAMDRATRHVLADAVTGLRGFVVWSSNRFGNHDILRCDLPDLTIRRLTTHSHVDTFPRISPDGTQVVFARSREPWVSQRNPLPWSIYRLNMETGEELLVSDNGNTPTWSEDGRSVYFQRDGGAFVAHDLATGQETLVFTSGQGQIPPSVDLQTPSFSERRQAMAVTFRGAKRATVVAPRDGVPRFAGGGCQIAWSPDASFLTVVDDGGRMKNAVYRVDPDTLTRSLWLDLPGAYSHEYFPRISNDSRALVLGACAQGHEHDTADYEIFLWMIGTPAETAVRLTYHTGNDCWPDLFLRTE